MPDTEKGIGTADYGKRGRMSGGFAGGAARMRGVAIAAVLLLPVADSIAADGPDVVARVGDEAITADEVERAMRAGLRGRKPSDESRPGLEAAALELVIGQRLIDRAVRREKLAPSDGQVDAAMSKIRSRALARHATFAEYLQEAGHTEASLRRQTTWRWGWRNYLAKHLTDERRQKYFEAHRREWDGTEVRVRHILLKVEEPAGPAQVAAAVERAVELRMRIADGQTTFAEAAMKYSAGPSAAQGGDLGFIPRRGQMVEEFSRAAFALAKGQLSGPVVTAFGVHLIECTDESPGELTWQDVRRDLEPLVIQELFDEIVAEERKNAAIEYIKR
jgi:parvulin-like peptidyl-prolyl isomerase